jgi:hypothetical protein
VEPHENAEHVLFSSGDLLVTPSRAVFGEKTFPVKQIAGLTTKLRGPDRTTEGMYQLIGVLGLIAAALAIVVGGAVTGMALSNTGTADFWCCPVGGLLLVPIAVLSLRAGNKLAKSARPTHILLIETSGGTHTAFTTQDAELFKTLMTALNAAIAAR